MKRTLTTLLVAIGAALLLGVGPVCDEDAQLCAFHQFVKTH